MRPSNWQPKGLLLLEGSDGTGKTTLAQHFVERYGAHYLHLTYRFPNRMWTYHAAALHRACKLSQDRLVVLDRQWVSEGIYANVYRGGSRWHHGGRMFDRVIQKHAGIYIFCLAIDLGTYSERYEKLKTQRFEMYENTVDVARQYNALFNGHEWDIKYPGYVYDCARWQPFSERRDAFGYAIEIEGQDKELFGETVLERLYERRSTQYRRALSLDDYNFLGHSAKARYVVIGDRINKTNRVIDYPWYAHKNSSLFLCEVWSKLGLRETDFVYTNANDFNGMTHMYEMIKEGKTPIALGSEALKLAPHREDLIYIPHPSYGRRFLDVDHYAGLLEPHL